MHRRHAIIGLSAFSLLGCTPPVAAQDRVFDSERGRYRVDAVTNRLAYPWGLDFMPDGRLLVTEKPGRLRIVTTDGKLSAPIAGVPEVVARGQGGLLDVTVHPDFAKNRLVYLSYTEGGPDGTNSTAAARGRLSEDGSRLTQVEVVFRQEPKLRGDKHYGSRIVFAPDGHMFITTGERSDDDYRVQSQDLDSLLGKVVRLNPDGTVPADNPFVGRAGARPEIWSYGHRNVQGADINPASGRLWTIEHGPRGGDEINIPEAGKNYGWPVVSHGINYSGSPVGSGLKQMAGMVDPIVTWTPVIAPCGMRFYSGAMFPAWKGNLFIAGLRSRALVRLELDGERVVREERLLEPLGLRLRDVAVGPDGAIYVISDERKGRLLRLSAAGS